MTSRPRSSALARISSSRRSATDPQRFPAVTAVLEADVMDQPDGPDDEFVFGLERLLDGIEVLVRERGAADR